MRYGITMGDAAGIGPEIIVKALADKKLRNESIVYGSKDVLDYYIDLLDFNLQTTIIENPTDVIEDVINVIEPIHISMNDFEIGKMNPICGDSSFKYLERAIQDCMDQKLSAIVTCPINKSAMNLAGHTYDGHTEAIISLSKAERCRTVLWSSSLKVIHVSTHVALKQACELVKKDRLIETFEIAYETLLKADYHHPKIGVAGLNPHAGENGLFGDEEIKEIIPAIEYCKEKGIDIVGPIPADTLYYKATRQEYDIVVSMYHDQGHIPMKSIDFDGGINLTAGLPYIRTSPGHGTGYDIAGRGNANKKSLLQAIKVAKRFMK